MGELSDLELKPHEQATYSMKTVLVMLFSRLCLFLFFQVLFFAGFAIAGDAQAWLHSANWWPFTVTFANIACFIALRHLLKKEGGSFREYFVFERRTVGKDIAWMVFFSTLANGIAFAFNYALGSLLFGDFAVTADLFLPSAAALGCVGGGDPLPFDDAARGAHNLFRVCHAEAGSGDKEPFSCAADADIAAFPSARRASAIV